MADFTRLKRSDILSHLRQRAFLYVVYYSFVKNGKGGSYLAHFYSPTKQSEEDIKHLLSQNPERLSNISLINVVEIDLLG